MKRKAFILLLAASLILTFCQPVFAAASSGNTKKTVWVIDYSKSSLRNGKDMIVTYNKKGLITGLNYVNRANYIYSYNKKNQITTVKDTSDDGSIVFSRTKCTYEGGRIKKAVKTELLSGEKTTYRYTWKSNGKVVKKITGRITDGTTGKETITCLLRPDGQFKSVKYVRESGNLKSVFTYSKKGFLTHQTYDYGLDYQYKTKLNARNDPAKITYSDNFSNYESKSWYKYHYKKIRVPAEVYDLVVMQQKYLLGLSSQSDLLLLTGLL